MGELRGTAARAETERPAPANRHAEAFGAKHPRESVHMVQPRARTCATSDANHLTPRRRTAFRLFLLSRLEKIAVGRTFF